MIIRSEALSTGQRTGESNGTMTQLLSTEQMHSKNRFFAHVLLRPGAKVPGHRHHGDFEVFYIIAGTGRVDDNAELINVRAGDVILTDNLESHSLENTGDTDLEYIALITLL
jgi:mannose-6-phosphate isomerase-like protein (cupin superfamily)